MTVADLKKWLSDKPEDAILLSPLGSETYSAVSPSIRNVKQYCHGSTSFTEGEDGFGKSVKAVVFW